MFAGMWLDRQPTYSVNALVAGNLGLGEGGQAQEGQGEQGQHGGVGCCSGATTQGENRVLSTVLAFPLIRLVISRLGI